MSADNLHKELESDIKRLSEEMEQLRGTQSGEQTTEKELAKQSLRAMSEREFLPEYLKEQGIEHSAILGVERLLDMVLHKGLRLALKESQKYSPFIQDAFHDALVDKLMPELEKRGIIKE